LDYLEDAQQALQRLQALQPARDNERLLDDLQRKLKRTLDSGHARVTTRQGHVVLKIAVDALFEVGEANVKPAGAKALAEIGAALSATGRRFHVEAHASAARSGQWGLCAARAMSVAKRLMAKGVGASAVSLAAFGALDLEAPVEPFGIVITVLRETTSAMVVENR
jgi:flagellar motor protein MotB